MSPHQQQDGRFVPENSGSTASAATATAPATTMTAAAAAAPVSRKTTRSQMQQTQSESHAAWHAGLNAAIASVKALMSPAQANSKAWKPVYPTSSQPNSSAALGSASGAAAQGAGLGPFDIASTSYTPNSFVRIPTPAASSVKVHRRPPTNRASRANPPSGSASPSIHAASSSSSSAASSASAQQPLLPPGSSQSADIYRAVCNIPLPSDYLVAGAAGEGLDESKFADLQDAFGRLLATPECKASWDAMVEDSEVIEELDAVTKICRTVFRLGWPASPRDVVTISRTIIDGHTLMDVSSSLPRSPDAPAYLRPAPPYVRSHLNLFAWCVQCVHASSSSPILRVTVFWSWDLRGAWLGMPAGGLGAQLPNLVSSLVSHVSTDSSRVPYLVDFGTSVEVTGRRFDATRDEVTIEYQVIAAQEHDGEEEQRARSLRWSLPADEGWDVHIDVKPLAGVASAAPPWSVHATRQVRLEDERGGQWKSARMALALRHAAAHTGAGENSEADQILRGRITIQRIAASHEVRLRVNDSPFAIEEEKACTAKQATRPDDALTAASLEGSYTPSSLNLGKGVASTSTTNLADDAASISGLSLHSDFSTTASLNGDEIRRTSTPSMEAQTQQPQASTPSRGAPPDRSTVLASLIRRNYIYFTSLLQEPEAKWKPYSDSRGVTITQLDSIDPTLVVFRAEATFVGVGVWDLFSTIANPGVRVVWDKGAEETRLLEDVGDGTRLWHSRIKGAWPVSARDAVTVETSYKSPSSIHIFSFSNEDRSLFSVPIPAPDPGTIRTQVDLRGWSIESLSPTTVHITLIEQSNPKGWTSKSATPSAMTAAVAGVGDFAIKSGAPPIVTRMLGAKTKLSRYDHDKGTFRIEYELNDEVSTQQQQQQQQPISNGAASGSVECEIRCDVETWANGLDLVVDPPPINVSCLRRHKLSQGGSGLWLTIEHVAASLEDDAARVTVRRAGASKEKGTVLVNGAKIKVDVDELKEGELAKLKERKRTKPKRIPLDLVEAQDAKRPSRLLLKDRSADQDAPSSASTADGFPSRSASTDSAGTPIRKTQNDEATALSSTVENKGNQAFSDERPRQPMTCALDVLFLLRRIYAERSPDPAGTPAGWALVSQRNGLFVRRKLMQSISNNVFVQRGDKIVEGLTAEDLLSAVASLDCRRLWDDKVDTTMMLETFGNGATTGFFTTKASFPFRGRAFHLASLTARSAASSTNLEGMPSGSLSTPSVFFHASASYPERNSSFALSKLNPSALPLGKVLIDGWILETLDPYSSTLNYQIPSTRCTHIVAVDYAGSLPAAVNTLWNANLPRSILAVEEYVKAKGALPSVRSPPKCVDVLGDARDEDTAMLWALDDDKSARSATLLSSTFEPNEAIFEALVQVESMAVKEASHLADSFASGAGASLLAFPSRRPVAISNASTTKAAAQRASSTLAAPASSDVSRPTTGESTSGGVGGGETISRTTSVSSMRSTNSFVGGLSSKTTPRPSVIRAESKRKPRDLIIMDVEVELRHYERGYEVMAVAEYGEEGEAKDARVSDMNEGEGESEQKKVKASPPKVISLDAASRQRDASDLDVQVASFDLPPSAVLAATLDPEARPRRHLVRLSLPTAAFTDVGQGLQEEQAEDEVPDWYQQLTRRGATVRLTIRPLAPSFVAVDGDSASRRGSNAASPDLPSSSSSSSSGEMADSQLVPAYFRGERLTVTHVNQTSAMLQRESDRSERHATLKRITPPPHLKAEAEAKPAEDVLDDRLPTLLQSPIAASLRFKRDPPSKDSAASTSATSAPKAVIDASVDDPDSPLAADAAANQGDDDDVVTTRGTSPVATTPTGISSSTPIMSILNAYPLSRLGASTAVTTAVANGGMFSSTGANDHGKTPGANEKLGDAKARSARQAQRQQQLQSSSKEADASKAMSASRSDKSKEDDSDERAPPGSFLFAMATDGGTFVRRRLRNIVEVRFTLATMILACLIAFLLGSLVRSLIEPADFVLMSSTGSVWPEHGQGTSSVAGTEQMALTELQRQFGLAVHGRTGAGASTGVAWREMRRLVEIKRVVGGWDLVIGAAARAGGARAAGH
ncbi:hypothetical protein FA10DRAFT_303412 [Acaromyces ingoldii]|uniref:START domain-containing protein n=1 Tax=Acaromyces ingoldii TaxID=215250 RepID=A0A316YIJ2_9BASI|nr:hypothetical protein FA10DRAFT_303412 [Acaromyces ingoldii]PWN88448.1 hypothetical protein FA10DRAFT_303412 [Acaromyces ingoldii]